MWKTNVECFSVDDFSHFFDMRVFSSIFFFLLLIVVYAARSLLNKSHSIKTLKGYQLLVIQIIKKYLYFSPHFCPLFRWMNI